MLVSRIKRILELSRYDLDKLDLAEAAVEIQELKPDEIPVGTFIEDMTEAEYSEWEREQTLGWAKFKKLIDQTINNKN